MLLVYEACFAIFSIYFCNDQYEIVINLRTISKAFEVF